MTGIPDSRDMGTDLEQMARSLVESGRTHEVIEFGHHFNAREAASPHNECKELATQFRVPFDIGFFENVNQVIAQDHGIGKRPKRHCVFHHAGHAVKVALERT
jgi:hypothetical protein